MKAILTLLFAVLIALPAFAGDGTIHKSRRPVPNRYLVQFEDFVESPEEEAKAIAEQYDVKLRRVFKYGVPGFSMEASPQNAAALSGDSRVEHVEEDSYGDEVLSHPLPPPDGPGWARDRINQYYLPLDHSAYVGCDTGGSGVVVYVLDTGINDPKGTEFGTRLTHGFTVETTFSDNYNPPRGHGTAVASIIGGNTYGVARNVKLVNVKVLRGDGTTTLEDKVSGINYVIERHELETTKVPKVMNLSWNHDISAYLEARVINAIEQGIVVVVSAGNENRDTCILNSPSRLGTPNTQYNPYSVSTITVGATQLVYPYTIDQRWTSSNFGPCVDIFAPGHRVDALRAGDGEHYSNFGGTSAAAPYVSGAVARHLSGYVGSPLPPGLPATVESSLKNYGTRNLIEGDVTPNLLLALFQCRRRPSN